jgi:hypothetical protein
MREAVGTAAVAALATLAFSAAVVSHPSPALAGVAAQPAFGQGCGPDAIVPAGPALWVEREVYDEDGNFVGRRLVNLCG